MNLQLNAFGIPFSEIDRLSIFSGLVTPPSVYSIRIRFSWVILERLLTPSPIRLLGWHLIGRRDVDCVVVYRLIVFGHLDVDRICLVSEINNMEEA